MGQHWKPVVRSRVASLGVGLACMVLVLSAPYVNAQIWTTLDDAGGWSTALGNSVNIAWWINMAGTPPAAAYSGYGRTSADGASWSWVNASWDYDNGSDARFTANFTPASTGVWYFAGNWNNWSKNYYADTGWRNAEDNTLNAQRTFTVTNLPWSTDCWVTNDAGPEALSLQWTRPGSYYVMIVRRLGDWPDPPANGTGYTNKQVYGTDGRTRVVYAAGNGSSSTDFELLPNTASNYYYAFYTENYSHYSVHTGLVYAGRTMQTNTPAFYPGEHVDSFSYFSGDIVGQNGGCRWTGAWQDTYGAAYFTDGSLVAATNYPPCYGNRIRLDPGNGGWAGSVRPFTNINSGVLYISFLLNVDNISAASCAQLILQEDDTEKIKIGYTGTGWLSIEYNPLGINSNSNYALTSDQDYTIIARYDFDTSRMDVVGYYINTEIPLTEPATWNGTYQFDSAYVTNFNRVRVGTGSWGDDPGNVDFDEIRLARSWEDLLQHATYHWDDSAYPERDWSKAENWTGNTEPISASNAYINGSYTGEVTQVGEVAHTLYIGNNAQGSLEQLSGELTLGEDLYLGGNAATEGTYEMSGGSLNVGDQTFLADGSTVSFGNLLISGGVATFSDDVFVGRNGHGLMTVSGTSTALLSGSTSHLYIGDLSGNNKDSQVQVDGSGLLSVEGNIEIGDSSATYGSLLVSGGVVNVDGDFNVGDWSTATGVVTVVGGAVTADVLTVGAAAGALGVVSVNGGSLDVTEAGDCFVGSSGTGIMNVDGTGDVNIGDTSGNTDFYVGNAATARGTVNQSNGTVTISSADGNSHLRLGVVGGSHGEYNLSGGTLEVVDDIYMANSAGSTGILAAVGGTLTAESLFLAYGGNARLSIAGAAVTLDEAQVGVIAGSTGLLEISSGSLDVTEAGNLQLGLRSRGVLNIDGTADVNIGDGSGVTHLQMGMVPNEPAQGTVNQSNGTVDITGSLYLGANASPADTYNLVGGSLSITSHVFVGQVANATGIVNAVAGTMTADELYVGYSGVGRATIDGATVTVDAGQIGVVAGSVGVLSIIDGSLDVTEAQNFLVGTAGSGILNVDGTGELNIGDDSGETQLILGNAVGGVGVINQSNGTVTVDAAGTGTGSSLQIGTSGYGEYNIAGGTLDILDAHIQVGSGGTGIGTFHVIGDSATISVGNDFRINNGNSTLKVSFVSSQISAIEVEDDMVLAGTLTIDDDGSMSAGSYTIMTSVNNSAVSGTFAVTNWLGQKTGTVSYADGAVVISFTAPAPIWDGGGADANWDTVGNWQGDTLPTVDADVEFYSGIGSGTAISLNGNQTVNSITFNDSADTSLTISSDALTIGGGGISVSADAAGAHTIASSVVLGDAQEWENLSTANFSINGVVSGSNPLRKKGEGTIRLMNITNTLTGGIWIDEGILYCNGIQGFGLGPVNVGTNAQFAVNGPGSAYTYFTPMTVNVYGAGNSWTNPSIRKTSGGRWNAEVNLYTNAGVNFSFAYGNGNVYNLNGHTLYHEGTLDMESGSILGGTRTDGDGAIYIHSGRFQIAGHGSLTGSIFVNSNSTLRLLAGGVLPVGGTLHFGDNASYNQKTSSDGPFRNYKHTEIAGKLNLGGMRGRPYIYGTVDLLGGVRELHLSSSSYDVSTYFFNSISNGGLIKTGSEDLFLRGTNTYSLGLSVYEDRVYAMSYSLPGAVYLSNDCSVILNQATTGTLAGPISGPGTVVKSGFGEVVVTGNNFYSGGTYVSNGVWIIEHANALGSVAGGTVISDGATLGMSGGIVSAAEPLTLDGYGVSATGSLRSDSGNNTFSGPITLAGYSRLGCSEGELLLTGDISSGGYGLEMIGSGRVRIQSSLDMLTTGSVNMVGNGFLILEGASTNSGGSAVSSGTLVQNGTNTVAPVNVSASAVLMGCGSAGAVDVSGTLCPGADTNSIAALAINSLTMRNGSSLQILIGDCDDTTDRGYVVNGSSPTIVSTVLVKPDSSLVSNWDASVSNDWTIISGNIASANGFSIDTSLWDTGSHPLNSGVFGLTENSGNLVLTFAPAAPVDIEVLGTNLAAVLDGDATPQLADGTDFNTVVAARDTKDQTFYITNSGLNDLTITSVTTAGTHMAEFTILEWPTVVSPGGEASNLVVRFEPSAAGVRTATLHVNNNDPDEADYDFAIQGTGVVLVGPYVTNGVAGVTNQVTDGQMTSGVFTVTMNICDADGINTTVSGAPHFLPSFSIWNPAGVQVLTDEVFSAFTHAASGQEVEAVDTAHAGVSYSDNILGTFTNWFSAENSNDVTTVDLADDMDGNPLIFTVVDDDTEPPVMGHFASNFIANAGFETGDITGWGSWGSDFGVSGDAADSGDFGLWMTNFNGGSGGSCDALIQHITLEPSTTYRMFCRARKVGAMDPAAVEIKVRCEESDWTDSTEIATNNFVSLLTTDWQTFELEFTTDASYTNYGCFVQVWNDETGSYEGRAEFDAFYVGLADDPAPMQVVFNSLRIDCTNQAVFGTTNAVYTITDQQLRGTYYKYFKFAVYDEGSGLSRGTTDSATQMNVTIYNPVSGGFWHPTNCSYYYSSYSSLDSATFNDGATNTWRIYSGYPSFEQTKDMLGTNQILVNVPDADNDRAGDTLWLTNAQFGLLEVVDDDSEPPQVTSNVFGRPMGVCVGTNWLTPVPDVDTTNAVFYINRDDLVNTNPFIIVISAYDEYSGMYRSTSGTYTNFMNISIGTAIVHNISQYDSSRSSSGDTSPSCTSTWTWTSFSGDEVMQMVGTNPVMVSLVDDDMDWSWGDQAKDIDHIFGTIIVTNGPDQDDDITPPLLKPVTYSDNLVTNGGFEYGFSGWSYSGLWSMGDYAAQTGTNGAAQGQGSYSYLRYYLPTNVPYRSPVAVTANFRRDDGATTNARLRVRVQSGTRYVQDYISTSWTQVGHTSSVTVASSYFYLDNYSPYIAASTVYWDNVEAHVVYGAMRVWAGDEEIGAYYGDQTDGYFYLYDQQLADAGTDPLRFVFYAYDPESGLSRGTTDNSTQMHISVLNWLTNDCSYYYNAGSSLFVDTFSSGASSVWRFTSFSQDQIGLMVTSGVMYVTSSIPNADFDTGEADREWLEDQQLGRIYVTDDDISNPGRTYFSSPVRTYVLMYTNDSIAANNGSTYTSTEWQPTDGFLANISVSEPFELMFRARDYDSGLARTNDATNIYTYCNITIPHLFTNDIVHYEASISAPFEDTFSYTSNGWRWTTPFSPEQIETLFQAGSQWISVHLADADNEWSQDYLTYNYNANYIALQDDDTTGPECSGFVAQGAPGISTVAVYEIVGGGWSITGLVRDTNSGINVNAGVMSDSANNISPYFTVKNSTGAVIIAGEAFSSTEGDGSGQSATYASVGSVNVTTPVDPGEACLGIYTVTVICADNDEDRTYDRLVTTNVVATFEVVEYDKIITIDGDTNDWVGVWPDIVNASTYSSGEFIWRDKEYDERLDPSAPANQDIYEMRMTANSSNLFFMVRFQDITDFAHPYIAIGVDTNQDPADTAHNWIGDDANTTMGDGYYTNGNAAMHYPDVQIIVHNIDGVGQRIELYDPSGDLQWEAPSAYAGTSTTWSAANDVMEFVIPRADLGLTGTVTGRFTVASYQNAQVWANAGDTTTNYTTCDAIDSLSIMSFNVNDSNLSHSAWDEDISDGDIDFYLDVRFNDAGIVGDSAPTAPVITSPLGNSVIEHGVGPFVWQPSTDADDEVTSYLLEVSTNATFNGDENGTIMARYNIGLSNLSVRVDEMSASAATQFYWRVRSRDLSGVLSPVSGPYMFQTTTTDSDTEGPEATLLYVGTNYTPGAAIKTELYDGELVDTNNPIDIAVMLTDPSGVFLTNHPPYPSTNIISGQGRVIPNWDVMESNTLSGVTWIHGHDVCFSNFYGYNGATCVTAYQYHAVNVTNIDLNKEYYLTVSAEDEDNNRGLTVDPQGDGDPIPADRMVRTNYLMSFNILDDDTNAPLQGDISYVNRYSEDPGFELSNTVWECSSPSYVQVRYDPATADSGDHYAYLGGTTAAKYITDTNYYSVDITNLYSFCFRARSSSTSAPSSSRQVQCQLMFYTNSSYHIHTDTLNIYSNLTDEYQTFVYSFYPRNEDMVVHVRFYSLNYSTYVYFDNAALCLASDVEWPYRMTLGDRELIGSYFNEMFTFDVTDEDLVGVCDTNPMSMYLKAHDAQSGLAREVTDPLSTQICLSVGATIVENTTNMVLGECSVDSTVENCTNVWRWEDFEISTVQELYTNAFNEVAIDLYDADADRVDDQAGSTNVYGYLHVVDDDTLPPGLLGTNEMPNGDFESGSGGWWWANTGNAGVGSDPAFAYAGNNYAWTRNASTYESMWNSVRYPETNATYIFSIWMKGTANYTNTGANAYMKAEICYNFSAPGGVTYNRFMSLQPYVTTNWQQFSMIITTCPDTVQIRAVVGFNNRFASETGTLYWDDVYLGQSADPFVIQIGSNDVAESYDYYIPGESRSLTNRHYEMTDGDMAAVSPANPLKFVMTMRDDSMVSRGISNVATQMNVSIDNIFTNNVANYRSDLSISTEETISTHATSVWAITSFTGQHITELLYTTSRVTATAYDLDADRGFVDVLNVTSQQYAYLNFVDDDTNSPIICGDMLLTRSYYASHHDIWNGSYSFSEYIKVHPLPIEMTFDAWGSGAIYSMSMGIMFYDAETNWISSTSRVLTSDITTEAQSFTYNCIPPENSGVMKVYLYVKSLTTSYSWAYAHMDNVELRYTSCFFIEQGTNTCSTISTNETLVPITDGMLADADATEPLRLVFVGRDAFSGLQRSSAGSSATQTHVTVGTWMPTNVANFDLTASSPLATNRVATNTWSWSGLPQTEVVELYTAEFHEVYLTLHDADGDRSTDQLYISNYYAGRIQVGDDDTGYPIASGCENWLLKNPGFESGTNGWTIASGWTNYIHPVPAAARDGSYGMMFSNIASTVNFSQQFDVLPNTEYELNVDARVTGDTSTSLVRIVWAAWSTNWVSVMNQTLDIQTNLTTSWQTFTINAQTPTNAAFSRVYFYRYAPQTHALLYLDNVTLKNNDPVKWYVGDTAIPRVDVDGTNCHYVTDAQLASVDGATPLQLNINAFDEGSGLARSAAGTASTQMNVTVGSWVSSNIANYSASSSSTNSSMYDTTNVWQWDSLSTDFIDELYTTRTHAISYTVIDNDHDRPDDELGYTNISGGVLVVTDDDEVAPRISTMTFGGVTLNESITPEPLRAGDIMPVGWNSDSYNLAFVLLADVPAGTTIYIRDDEWNGNNTFYDVNEGTLSWTAPASGAPAGTVIEIDNSGNVNYGTGAVEDAGFAPANSGDQVWFYTAPTWSTGPFDFLCAFETYNYGFGGNLDHTGLTEYETALAWTGYADNWNYKRTVTTGSVAAVRAALQDPANWESSDGTGDQSFTFDLTPFNVEYEPLDIAVVGWNSDGDDEIAFLPLRDVLGEQILYFRDDEWDGTNAFFDSSEGTLKWTAPIAGVNAGTVVVIDGAGNASAGTVEEIDAGFDIANSSDQIWIYTASGWDTGPFKMRAAFETASSSFGGDLTRTELGEGTNVWAWGNSDNWRYDQSLTTCTRTELWAALQNSANWDSTDGSGDQSYAFAADEYTLLRGRLDLTDADIGTLVLTGYVFDTVSGLVGGTGDNAPTVTVYNASGTVVAGSYLSGASDGDGTMVTAPVAFASSALNISGAFDVGYTAVVEFADYDQDRTRSGVNSDMRTRTELIAFTLRDDDTNRPNLFGFRFDDTLQPTDGEVADGLSITGLVQDASGIYSTTSTTYRPIFSLFSPTNTVISLSNMNDRAITPDGGATTDTAIGQDAGSVQIPYDSRMLGTWTAQVEVVDYDSDRIGDELTCTSNFVFTVVDDDTNAPDVSLVAHVTVGGSDRYVSGAGTDRVFQITEGDMANLDTAPLEIILKPYDEHTGIARAMVGPETNMNVSVADFITNDVAHFCASNSSALAETQNSSLSSNIWQWDTPYGYAELGDLFGTTGWYSRILADIPDADDDRPDDMLWTSNRQFGFLQLVDDDIVSPTNYKLMDVYHVKNGVDFEDEASGGTSTNRIFTFSDGELRALSADTQLWFSIYARDEGSGFPRGTTGATTNMHISIPNFTTNNVANFSPGSSSATTNSDASNVWAFSTALTYDQVTALHGDYGCTNPILVTLPFDSDNDRANDAMPGYTNWQLGYFEVNDDDVTGPQPRANITASFTNPALEVYLGGDYHLNGYSGTNVWQGRALNVGDTVTNADERFVVTDEDLANVASTNPFMLKAWFWDSASGLMGHGDSATNKSLSLGSAIVSNAEAFSPTYSVKSVDIDGSSRMSFRSTNYWVWTNFTYEQVGLLHTNSAGHSNTVVIHSWDADMDRANDQAHSNLVMGTLIVLDDDTNAPMAGGAITVNLLRNPSFETQGATAEQALYWNWMDPDEGGATWGNDARRDWRSHSGSWEGTIPGQWGAYTDDFGGWWQRVTNSYVAGTMWGASAWFWNDATWTRGGSYLSLQFHDINSNRISGVTNWFDAPGEAWTRITVEGTSPPSTVWTHFEVATWGMNNQGALQFDDAELGPYVAQALAVDVAGSNITASSGSGTNAIFTVSDGDLAGTVAENLLINEGFESNLLVGWTSFNYGTNCTWAVERGTKGYAFPAYVGSAPSWGHGGIYQDIGSVSVGDTYTFSMRARKETNFWADYVFLKLEFRDGASEVATYTNSIPVAHLDDGWYGYNVEGVAPGGATFVRVVAMYSGGTNDGPAGSWLWDNATLVRQSVADDGIQMRFSAFDENGMARGTTDPATEMNVAIEHWCDSDVHNYKSAFSTEIRSNSGISAWAWNRLDKATVSALYNAGTNRIAADMFDGDDDRPFDGKDNTNQQFGLLHVVDDDTNGPLAQMIEIDWGPACSTNYITDGKLHVGNFGISVTLEDSSSIMTNLNISWMPDFSLVSPTGATNLLASSYDSYYPMTNGTVIKAWRNWAGSIAYTNVQTGVWEVVWSAQDNDDDRYDDRAYRSHSRQVSVWSNIFVVVDDDTSTPLAPTNMVASATYWTNINDFAFTWDPAVDDSGIASDGYRVSTNASPAIDEGTPMVGNCETNFRTLTFDNLGFEIGDGQGGQAVSDNTHGWWSRSGIGGYGHFSNTEAQEGTNSMRVSCDSGVRPNGDPRYTLIQAYIPIDNTNDYGGIVQLSGWFNGDLSVGAFGDYCCAFLKMEFCDASSNIIAPAVGNEYDDGYNGRPGYGMDTDGNWSNMTVIASNMPANTEYVLASVGIGNNNSKLACYGYWDHLAVSVGLVTPAGLTGASYTNAVEGSNTVYLYVVDDDNDRPGDQLMSSVTNFTIMYDATAPLVVTNLREGIALDDTSEIKLEWDALPDGGNSNLAPWHSYFVYYTDEDRNPTTNDMFFDLNNGPLSLATNITSEATFSNFMFGETYRLAVAGADRAGNVSALSSSVVVTLAGFYLTQGVTRASADADLSWTATNTFGEIIREFDLLYVDAYDFSSALTSQWKLAGGVTNSCFMDRGGTNRHGQVRKHPQALTNVMRFYRASLHDMWRTNRSVRSASAEIYVLKNILLYPGQNWVQLPGIPDTNTVAFVLGSDLPAGPTAASPSATKVSWYERGETWVATQEVGLVSGSPNHWAYTDSEDPGGNACIPLQDAFVVEIPTNASKSYKVTFIGRVPTNGQPQVIAGNTSGATDYGAHSLISYNLPRRIHPAQMSLREAGFVGWGGWPPGKNTDAMWRWQTGNRPGPKLTYRTGNWYNMQTWNVVPTNYFQPDDGIVVQIKNSAQDFGWTNPILYPAPHRKMSP